MMPVFVGHELSHGHPSMSPSANRGDFHQTWGPHMTTDLYSRITQQQQLLDQLRADAPDIAATLADEVWDRFEVEIEEVTEFGIDFDFAQSIAISLSLSLAQAYERAFEHHVLERCERLSASLAQAMEQQTIDTARINLTGMRKELKLRRHAQELIEQAIERAKPSAGRMLSTVLCGIFRDPLEGLDALEKVMQEDVRSLRREVLSLRESLRARMTEESLSAILGARLELARLFNQKAREALASSAADPS